MTDVATPSQTGIPSASYHGIWIHYNEEHNISSIERHLANLALE
jgi:hypothetical protein